MLWQHFMLIFFFSDCDLVIKSKPHLERYGVWNPGYWLQHSSNWKHLNQSPWVNLEIHPVYTLTLVLSQNQVRARLPDSEHRLLCLWHNPVTYVCMRDNKRVWDYGGAVSSALNVRDYNREWFILWGMGLNWDKLVGVTTDSCPHSDWKTSLSSWCKIK